MTVILVVGTRPQIIKSAPIAREAIKQGLPMKIIHTGQHYDTGLSQVFFEELSAPEPFVKLNVGSGSHVFQTAEIMMRLEKHLAVEKPSVVLIPGDTNSALAGAIASVKMNIAVAHLESGARSYDMHMAEEINRRLIDHCSKILFAATRNCKRNLQNESVTGMIYQTGDTMFDIFLHLKDKAEKSDIIDKLNLTKKEYVILTTHRAENVDDPVKLKKLFRAMQIAEMPIIFPIHPRTKNRLNETGISLNDTNIHTIDPVGYIEMLSLIKNAKIVITDSGGLQKEAFWSKTPCITIREQTEWIETVNLGVNFIAGLDETKINQAIKYIQDNYVEIKSRFRSNPFGDGNASKRIIEILKENAS